MVTKDTSLNEPFDKARLYADTIVQSAEYFRVRICFSVLDGAVFPRDFALRLDHCSLHR